MCLAFVGVGIVLFPQNSLFWIASSSQIYQHVREGLGLVLLVQFVTRPPRHVWVRILSGSIAIAVGIWVVEATYSNQMLLLDSLSFLAASIVIGFTALERRINTRRVWSSDNNAVA